MLLQIRLLHCKVRTRGHKEDKNEAQNLSFQLAILLKVSPFVSSFVIFGSWEFRIDPPSLPEDLEKTLRFSGPPFDLLSLNYLNVKITRGSKFLQLLQVVPFYVDKVSKCNSILLCKMLKETYLFDLLTVAL
jgi:hypothetical protein